MWLVVLLLSRFRFFGGCVFLVVSVRACVGGVKDTDTKKHCREQLRDVWLRVEKRERDRETERTERDWTHTLVVCVWELLDRRHAVGVENAITRGGAS